MSDTKIKLTVEEGQQLLVIASSFQLPERLGETTYSIAERSIAGDETRRLYRELRAHSPMMLKKERFTLFGPATNYEELKNSEGAVGHKMADTALEVEVRLDEDAHAGACNCLLLALHPASPIVRTVGLQEEIFWPLAEKLGVVASLREEIKLKDAKPRRWKRDEQKKEETKSEEKAS